MTGNAGTPPNPFTFSLASAPYVSQTKGGTLQVVDSTTFKVSTTIAAALQTIRPGGIRQMHWHPNADEWQYYIKGKARMGVFNTGPNVRTMDFSPGILATPHATTDIMWRTTATRTCNFSLSLGRPNSKRFPCRIGLLIPAGNGSGALEHRPRRRSPVGQD